MGERSKGGEVGGWGMGGVCEFEDRRREAMVSFRNERFEQDQRLNQVAATVQLLERGPFGFLRGTATVAPEGLPESTRHAERQMKARTAQI